MIIFENCLIQAPDGINLSRCSVKKLQWYLDNRLATLVGDNPPTIRLNFEPSGREGIDDPLLLAGKPNLCVVCGTVDNLTRHHIVPYCFIRHMKLEYKLDTFRDIYPLCEPCHQKYEKESFEKKKEMAAKLGITVNGLPTEQLRQVWRVRSWAATLLKHGHLIPPSRKTELLAFVREHLKKNDVTESDLEFLSNQKITEVPEYTSFSKLVAENVDNYDDFAKKWREHFVQTMNPQFMPEVWQIDRKAKHLWIPKRFQRIP